MDDDGEIDKEFALAAVPDDLPNREVVLAAIEGCAGESKSIFIYFWRVLEFKKWFRE